MVTGGASGLGRATAEMFIQNGARAVILDLPSPKSKGPEIAAKLAGKQSPSPPTKDDQCVFLPTDVGTTFFSIIFMHNSSFFKILYLQY